MEAIATLTFNDHGKAMLDRVDELLEVAAAPVTANGDARIDLVEARRHLEDALTRFNGAVYRIAGRWDRADSERVVGWYLTARD